MKYSENVDGTKRPFQDSLSLVVYLHITLRYQCMLIECIYSRAEFLPLLQVFDLQVASITPMPGLVLARLGPGEPLHEGAQL